MSGMMTDILRKSLELFRLIPRSDLLARVTPTHPTPDQIVPGEMTIVRDGVARVVPNERGAYTTPSVVAFTNEGGTLTGEAAQALVQAADAIETVLTEEGEEVN